MKVIHYIADFGTTAGPTAQSVYSIILSTTKVAENVLVTSSQHIDAEKKATLEEHGIKVFSIPLEKKYNPLSWWSFRKGIKNILNAEKPDIVHIHASWDASPALMECISRHQGYVTVVSPHGTLTQQQLRVNFWKEKLFPLLTYYGNMMRKSILAIALSQKERDDIVSMKKHVEVMSELLSNASSAESFAQALMTAYRKAIDTCYNRFLTDKERLFVEIITNYTVSGIIEDKDLMAEADTTDISFRRIYFHAYDEDVLDRLRDGAKQLNINIPPIADITSIPRYISKKAKRRGAITDLPLPRKSIRLDADSKEFQVVALLLRAHKEGLKRLTLRHLSEFYTIFMNDDFDEDVVTYELKRLKINKFVQKLQAQLKDMYYIPDGFMITYKKNI